MKNQPTSKGSRLVNYFGLALSHTSEAIGAVDRSVGLGLKRNLSLAAASCASSGKELSGATLSVLASVTASLAALGLVLEASFSVEFLLTSGKGELGATLFADQNLVFVHSFSLSFTDDALGDPRIKILELQGGNILQAAYMTDLANFGIQNTEPGGFQEGQAY